MEKGGHRLSIAVLTCLYRLLLFCYPKEFRSSFAAEMVDVYTRRCQRAAREGGLSVLFRVAIAGLVDLLATASAERADLISKHRPTLQTFVAASASDARYAVRTLAKRPGFSGFLLLTLTLAIGGTTAVFSIINATLLKPLPFKDPKSLVTLWELLPQGTSFGAMAGIGVAPRNYLDWKAQNHVFSEMALIGASNPLLQTPGGSQQLQAERVSQEFFDLLGIRPQAGRDFHREDFVASAAPVVIISHDFWTQFLGASPDALGRTLKLDGEVATVVGIMAADMRLPSLWGRTNEKPDVWIPLHLTNEELESRRYYAFRPIARLTPKVTLEQADAEMAIIAGRLSAQYPETNAGMRIGIVAIHEQLFQDLRTPLLLLSGATAFVLLIACANVANLLLVRADKRRREFAIRAAVGATRGSIIRQSLIESLILAFAATVCGLLAARWTIPLVLSLIPMDSLMPRLESIPTDFRTLGFAFLVSGLTALVFGVAPALSASRTGVSDALKEGSRTIGEGRRAHVLSNILVICEVALALVLVVSAAVLVQSFQRLNKIDPGFRPAGLLTLEVRLPAHKYKAGSSRNQVYTELLQRAKALPGIQSAAIVTDFPDAYIVDCFVEGRPVASSRVPQVVFRAISPGFFETLSLPVRAGRDFTDRDSNDKPRVAVISEGMARSLWQGENPLGKRFRQDSGDHWRTVIGIVRDTKRKTTEGGLPEYYVPYTQVEPWAEMKLIARTEGDPILMTPFLRGAIHSYDSDIAIGIVSTLEQILGEDAWRQKLSGFLMGFFASVAVLLAVVGIYAVMSNTVAQRTNEMGVRLALGAQPRQVRSMVMGNGLRLVASGVVVGLAIVFAVSRLAASYLYGFSVADENRLALARQIDQPSGILFGTSSTDPVMLAAVAMLLTVFALTAAYVPARRATKADPLSALRSE